MTKASTIAQRTNEEWVTELQADGELQASAILDLQNRLHRSIYFYLSRERSDLRKYAEQDLVQMAHDLAQDATLRVMDNVQYFRGESRFTTWANKIAIRLAISELRRTRYKDFSLDELTADGELLPSNSSAPQPGQTVSPERAAEQADVAQQLEAAFKEALTERQYQALVAVALQGVPMDVVAERMGTNRNALYKLIHDARRKLRRHLEAQGLPIEYMMKLFAK